MSHFADPTGFAGRLGALSAFGPTIPGLSWTFPLRFGVFRIANRFGRSYESLDQIQELFGLRWSLIKLPGISRRYLLFETIFIDDWESYLNLLVHQSHFGINAHSIGLSGYPGVERVSVFMQYLAERHRPALHLYAANPQITIRDIRRTDVSGSKTDPTWFSMLVPISSDRVTAVRRLFDSWNQNSGFVGPSKFVHFGRVLLIQEIGRSYLYLSVLHVAPPGALVENFRSGFERAGRESDTRLLLDLVGATQISDTWAELFTALGLAFATPYDAITWVLSKRTGVRRRDAIRYADSTWCWSPNRKRT
jgi:hypothetical protein